MSSEVISIYQCCYHLLFLWRVVGALGHSPSRSSPPEPGAENPGRACMTVRVPPGTAAPKTQTLPLARIRNKK